MQYRIFIGVVALAASLVAQAAAEEWRDFRGSGATGLAEAPVGWSLEDGRQVAWSADLPGRGVSGPIVVDGRVIVTASDGPSRQRLYVAAFDQQTGDPLWRRRFVATGRTFCHSTSANAAPTPASDGERIYAFFSSTELIALTLDGDVEWIRCLALDHPGVGNDVGMASSPVAGNGVVVVQAECQRNSFALAVEASSGRTLWEKSRPEESNWATPLVVEGADQAALTVLLQSRKGVEAYRLADGKELWQVGLECDGVTSLVKADNRLLLPSAGLTSLALAGETEPTLQWRTSKLSPQSASPVVADGRVLVVGRSGVIVCGDVETGELLWRRRLGGRFWATPAISGSRACCINAEGKAWVLDMADDGKVLCEADFGEPVLGSPAIAGDALYVRTHTKLWKLGSQPTEAMAVAGDPIAPLVSEARPPASAVEQPRG